MHDLDSGAVFDAAAERFPQGFLYEFSRFTGAAFTKHHIKDRVSHHPYTDAADNPRMPQNGDSEDTKMVRAVFSGPRATARPIDKRVGA